jgi:hypothetical protein
MKPYISIHQNSVSAFEKAGFKIYNVSILKCDKTDQLLLHINWTGDDSDDSPHFHELKYADGGKSESSGNGKIYTEIYFTELRIGSPDSLKGEAVPDWMEAATISIGIDFEESSTDYSILYTTFAKREATVCFAKYGDWNRFKQVSFQKEIDPCVKGDC